MRNLQYCLSSLLVSLVVNVSCADKAKTGGESASNLPSVANPQSSSAGSGDEVVATYGKKKITVKMVQKELEQLNPYLRMRFSSVARKKEFAKNLLHFEVMAEEALRLQLDKEPEVVRRVKQSLANKMMAHLRKSIAKPQAISEAEITEYYQKNKQHYQKPLEQVKHQIESKLVEHKRIAAIERYLEQLKHEAEIQVLQGQVAKAVQADKKKSPAPSTSIR